MSREQITLLIDWRGGRMNALGLCEFCVKESVKRNREVVRNENLNLFDTAVYQPPSTLRFINFLCGSYCSCGS
jgi:hypothetical protein